MQLTCPSCGGGLDYKSKQSVFWVCPYCQSTLVKKNLSVESIGKMAALLPDISPLQIGTEGAFEGRRFAVAGKQRLKYEHGGWNEWYLYFDDGTTGWLGEAQGNYMVSFIKELTVYPEEAEFVPGGYITANNKMWTVEDIKTVEIQGSIGELPLMGFKGKKFQSIDLAAVDGSFASFVYDDEETYFEGKYVEFDELKLTNLRAIDGW